MAQSYVFLNLPSDPRGLKMNSSPVIFQRTWRSSSPWPSGLTSICRTEEGWGAIVVRRGASPPDRYPDHKQPYPTQERSTDSSTATTSRSLLILFVLGGISGPECATGSTVTASRWGSWAECRLGEIRRLNSEDKVVGLDSGLGWGRLRRQWAWK